MDYFPDSNWESIGLLEAGFSSELQGVIDAAESLETDTPADLSVMLPKGTRHPNDRPLGPLKPRGKPSGVVVKDGYIVAQYGDVNSTEVTFSVTKSYISAVAGIAIAKGLMTDLNQLVAATVRDGGFESKQNSAITWRHLLQQTSEWEGELFGIPDWIDRGRQVGSSVNMSAGSTVGGSVSKRSEQRVLLPPGSFWEYNDVRVNRMALALLRLFNEPLPLVLKKYLMDPIDASPDWQWHGYETSWVDVGGEQIQSVSGGAHWGGGLWISTLDHARFGLLYANGGRWREREILSRDWVGESLTPGTINPAYGLLWWLNHDHSISAVADKGAFAARGAGGNIVFVWPSRKIIIVLRWCADTRGVIDGVLGSLK